MHSTFSSSAVPSGSPPLSRSCRRSRWRPHRPPPLPLGGSGIGSAGFENVDRRARRKCLNGALSEQDTRVRVGCRPACRTC